jgi:hypothetical protein
VPAIKKPLSVGAAAFFEQRKLTLAELLATAS